MSNYIGDIVYVTNEVPTTNDAAGFEALAWTKAKGVQTNPKFGVTHAVIEVEDLESGFTKGEKGAGQGTQTDLSFRLIDADAGQVILRTAASDPGGLGSVKVVRRPSGGVAGDREAASGDDVEYAQGFFHSYTPTDRTVSNFEGFTVSFRQNELEVISTEPA